MAIGTIITCTGPEDLFRKAEDLLRHGIHTEFVGRNTMKVVSIQPQSKVSKMNPTDADINEWQGASDQGLCVMINQIEINGIKRTGKYHFRC